MNGKKKKKCARTFLEKAAKGFMSSSYIFLYFDSTSELEPLSISSIYWQRPKKKKKQLVVMPWKRKIYSHSLTIWKPLLSTKYVLSCIELPSLELQTLVSLGYNLVHIVSFHKVAHYRPLSSLALQRAFPIFPSAVSFPTKSFKCQRIIYKRARGKF